MCEGIGISREDQRHWQQVWFEQHRSSQWRGQFLRWLRPQDRLGLVRVDDLEQGPNEQRDVMSGVFLAIKNGKVTDQLNEGCTITTDYACVDDDGKRRYQLLGTGKFQKLN